MPDTHPPCARCSTTDPAEFEHPSSMFCRPCWAWQIDPDRRFRDWAESTIANARGRGPFFA
jgi:hypothetical protein